MSIRSLLVCAVLLTAPVFAQDATAPVLSDADKKVLIDASKDVETRQLRLENFQLKAQQAQTDYDKAVQAFQKLVAEKTPPGYQIQANLDLVKLPAPVPAK